MEEQWNYYKQAHKKQKQLIESLCTKYDCYEWEIPTEQKKTKNQRKEILPYIKKHLENGVCPSEDYFFTLMQKHKIDLESEKDELEIDLDWFDDQPVGFLEDVLKHLITRLRTK